MCGYTNYQDPRLIPPDINDTDGPYDYRNCAHGEACRRVFERESPSVNLEYMGYEGIARMLECEICDLWEE